MSWKVSSLIAKMRKVEIWLLETPLMKRDSEAENDVG